MGRTRGPRVVIRSGTPGRRRRGGCVQRASGGTWPSCARPGDWTGGRQRRRRETGSWV
ncbi:unnamed protein product [Spirodela intermedia]|uniref:Uncharacterized protein n=1 Tax=Spirodela intermedia TaxID=51605 RepID=A0A7I8KJA8_SPIIN|nr:unnamed protein product [Spirodela intermedia]